MVNAIKIQNFIIYYAGMLPDKTKDEECSHSDSKVLTLHPTYLFSPPHILSHWKKYSLTLDFEALIWQVHNYFRGEEQEEEKPLVFYVFEKANKTSTVH